LQAEWNAISVQDAEGGAPELSIRDIRRVVDQMADSDLRRSADVPNKRLKISTQPLPHCGVAAFAGTPPC
jgi:hypothetical protein